MCEACALQLHAFPRGREEAAALLFVASSSGSAGPSMLACQGMVAPGGTGTCARLGCGAGPRAGISMLEGEACCSHRCRQMCLIADRAPAGHILAMVTIRHCCCRSQSTKLWHGNHNYSARRMPAASSHTWHTFPRHMPARAPPPSTRLDTDASAHGRSGLHATSATRPAPRW